MGGDATSKKRDETFEWFKKTPGSVLVTNLVKEGVSVNEIKALIVADYVGDPEVANQIIGRAIRPKQGADNTGHIVWFIDRQNKSLLKGCRRVFDTLETKKGYVFHHPVEHPEDIKTALVFSGRK